MMGGKDKYDWDEVTVKLKMEGEWKCSKTLVNKNGLPIPTLRKWRTRVGTVQKGFQTEVKKRGVSTHFRTQRKGPSERTPK